MILKPSGQILLCLRLLKLSLKIHILKLYGLLNPIKIIEELDRLWREIEVLVKSNDTRLPW